MSIWLACEISAGDFKVGKRLLLAASVAIECFMKNIGRGPVEVKELFLISRVPNDQFVRSLGKASRNVDYFDQLRDAGTRAFWERENFRSAGLARDPNVGACTSEILIHTQTLK